MLRWVEWLNSKGIAKLSQRSTPLGPIGKSDVGGSEPWGSGCACGLLCGGSGNTTALYRLLYTDALGPSRDLSDSSLEPVQSGRGSGKIASRRVLTGSNGQNSKEMEAQNY